ncbi:MAG TPA: TldD/PmbA family protein [Bryobacteraceae bacterium]|nr:TldD/PmbA family protein [Bryobacteraceae bacterium]
MSESILLPRRLCQELFQAAEQAAARAGARDIEVAFAASDEALTRFANNEIHQNVAEQSSAMSVRTIIDGRTARVTTNRLHRDGIQAAVDQAIALTKAAQADPALLSLYAGTESVDGSRFSEAIANSTPADRGRAVAEAIRIVEAKGQTAAGIYSTAQNVEALLNSAGVFRYYQETLAQFSITAMAEDSSGWAKASGSDPNQVQPARLAETAARKAAASRSPRELPPGRYTVILEPAAVLDLVGQIFGDFSATAMADQRSFLNQRLGTKLFGENICISDDAGDPLQTGARFDGEGVARQPLMLVERGVVSEVAWSRSQAAKAGRKPTGHGYPLPNELGEAPVNIVLAGGSRSVEDLIAGTANGILVTRLWYIREVEPYEKVMTGMTRDGTFLIKDGEVGCGLKNFRFNQSVIELLSNVEELSASVRASGEEAFDMVMPGMKAHGFHFTEVTRF